MRQAEILDTIPLRVVDTRRNLEIYQVFVLTSLILAVAGGFALAIVVPLSRALGWGLEADKPELTQVHGQLQLLGFAGLYVMGMSLRLLPRFSGLHLRHSSLVLPAYGLLVGGILVRAFIQPWTGDDLHSSLSIGSQFAIAGSGVCFALVVAGTLFQKANRWEATSYFFLFGSGFFLLQGVVGVYVALNEAADPTRVVSLVPETAIVYLQLAGFIFAFLGGVSTRAVPTLVGRRRPETPAKVVALVQAVTVVTLAGTLLWLEYGAYSSTLARVADAALAALGPVFLAVVWLVGVFRPEADRVQPTSRPHFWLVRSAFAWLTVVGVLALYSGIKAFVDGTLPGLFEVDAVRHALGVGVLTTLIMGMSLMILPEFAGQRLTRPNQAATSYLLLALLNAAAILRVAPALAGLHWAANARAWSMAAAGILAETALVVFALSFADIFLTNALPPMPGARTAEG